MITEYKPTSRDIICEELGINDDVVKLTRQIIQQINQSQKDIPWTPTEHENIEMKNIQISCPYDNTMLNVNCHFYKLLKEIDNQKLSELKTNARYNKTTNTIIINGFVYKNLLIANFYEGLQHEIEHFFHFNKMQPRSEKTIELYNLAQQCHKFGVPQLDCIADIIYSSRKFEQQAYLNGAYAKIMQYDFSSNSSVDEYRNFILKYTKLGLNYRNICYIMDKLSHYNEQELETLIKDWFGKFGFNLHKIKKLGNQTIKKLERQIERLIVKIQKDNQNNLEN